jgi:hypothetical protein
MTHLLKSFLQTSIDSIFDILQVNNYSLEPYGNPFILLILSGVVPIAIVTLLSHILFKMIQTDSPTTPEKLYVQLPQSEILGKKPKVGNNMKVRSIH